MRIAVGVVLAMVMIVRLALATPEKSVSSRPDTVTSRRYLQLKLLTWLPGDSGALASGILLGGDDDLSSVSVLAFRRAGLSHITAASGYNVVVVAGWIMAMLARGVGRRRALYGGILGVVIYMYLAGMTIPVIRAGLMVILTQAGLVWGRKTDSWWSLGLTTMGMICVKPAWAFEVSFQLSVAATAGVVAAGGWGKAWLTLKTSLAAWVATMPLILHHFGQLSLVAPLANLGVVWMVPPVMEVLGLAVVAGVVWDGLGWLVALAAWPGLKFMLVTTSWFASWPGANIEVGRLGWMWVIGYYMVISLVMIKWHKWRQ